MLPSTGYFKSINCPFYENGLCDRPYCHFKHSKREDGGGTTGVAGVVETQAMGQTQEARTKPASTTNSEVLQQLVTEAVKKVLADQEVTNTERFSENIVSQVVEELKPTLARVENSNYEAKTSSIIGKHVNIPTPITKPVPCVYNPTPIAELKKRHIPVVSYMPVAKSRVAVKRKASPDGIKPWLGVSQESDSSNIKEITYKPTAIVNSNDNASSVQSYIPTCKSDSSSSNSYEDSNSNDYMSRVKEAYYPKSKKRREEYVPRKIKAPLKTMQHLHDPVINRYESELDMFDEILTSGNSVSATPLDEEAQDYCIDAEPKFSDDEEMQEPPTDTSSTKKDEECRQDSMDEKEKENVKSDETDVNDENHQIEKDKSHKESDKSSNKKKEEDHRVKSHRKNETHEDSKADAEKKVKNAKHSSDKRKTSSEHKSSSKSSHKDKKEHHGSSSAKDSKDKHKHKSSSSNKHHSSSKDQSKSKHKHSGKSSHRSEENSESRHEKEKKDKHKSSKHEESKNKTKTKSSSRSRSDKNESDKSDKDHRSKKHSRSSQRSDHSKKQRKSIESSSERHVSDDEEEKSNSSFELFEPLPSPIHHESEISDSDHDVEEECLKIFQEYQVTGQPSVVSVKECSGKSEMEESEESGRKRIAHPSAANAVTRQVGPSQPPKKCQNPQQRMYERWRVMKEASIAASTEKSVEETSPVKTSSSISSNTNIQKEPIHSSAAVSNNNEAQLNGNGRIRIAHVPYAMSLAMAKKKVTETIEKAKDAGAKTAAQTTKGGRVAHVPQVIPNLIRPEPLQPGAQKFPLNTRQYYINIMHDICVQIYTNGEDAAERAQQEELSCHDRCKALPVYKNSCMLAAHRLRKEVDQNKTNASSGISSSGMVSHEAVLAGKSKGTWSVLKTKKSVMNLKGPALYGMLTKWIMAEQQLRDNGFPRPHPEGPNGRAKVYVTNPRNHNILSKVPNERICSRCGQNYMVDKYGLAIQQQNCIYHWGRKFTIRGEGKYSCCQQYGSATGCCDAKAHVWDYVDYENLRGYVKTLPKDVPDEEQGVFALDCEMCYTTQGLELTRVTVINEDCKVIYETLVKPQNPIIDYNTRFSGITEEDMKEVATSLLDVQATLLTMFSDKTILVGHSLESDFRALRLIHDTVVDTSVMFPHRNGYPQKRALKNLCSEYLRKIIQNDLGGHDSKEDALACMELILWKVKEEAKLQ